MVRIANRGPLIAFACLAIAATTAFSQSLPRPALSPGQTTNWSPAPELVGGITTQNISGTLTPADLAATILGTNVVIQNVTFAGAQVAAGTFQGGSGILGFESGIVLSSGNMNSIAGPNANDATSTINATPSDPDLAALVPGYTVFDSCVLEFDFACPTTLAISFQFVFASEEYNEWVNSPFNDVFGFFVNGQNIAIVPGTAATPVSINNVNCGNPYAPPGGGSHCSQFINNDLDDGGGSINTEMDGLTLVFTATAFVNPGFNHIKLAIGDAGDQVLDSNVMIKAGSLTCGLPGPVCELPMPALELGAGPQAAPAGSPFTHAIRAIATNGQPGQQVTVTSVDVTKDGAPMAIPAGASIAPALPVTGQPALSTFAWTPNPLTDVGTWRFTYHLADQNAATGSGTVEIVVSSPGNEDVNAFLIASSAQAFLPLGGSDVILIDLSDWVWFDVSPGDVPDFEIIDDPALLGLQFYIQVALYDPVLFPTDPIKTSNGLHVTIGLSSITSYGTPSGIFLWSTTPPLLDTDFTVDFSIL